MIWNIFQWRSLKTRVTLFTLAIFVLSIWALEFSTSRMLREDMQRLLSEQQFSTASIVAAEVNQGLVERINALEASPTPGIYPLIDRFIQGYEGSGVEVNPVGVEVLASAKGVPVAGWYVNAALPTAEAFAPIKDMQQRMLLTTIFLTLLAAGLTWWMIRRQLAPMLATAETLATLSDTNRPTQPLPITSQDEIGDLIGGFNRLLETLAVREQALNKSETQNRAITQSAHDAIITSGSEENILGWNHGAEIIFGYAESEIMGQPMTLLIPERYLGGHLEGMNRIRSGGEHRVIGKTVELSGLRKDGSEFPLELSLAKWESADGWFVTGIVRDITERRQMEDQVRQLAFYDIRSA